MTAPLFVACLALAQAPLPAAPREAVVTVAVENMYAAADDGSAVVSQATLGEGLYHDAEGRPCLPDIRPDDQLARGEWECRPPQGGKSPLRWQPTDETIANPQNQYGISKIAEEKISLHLGRRYGVPSVAMRYSIVQGPRQSFYNAYSGGCLARQPLSVTVYTTRCSSKVTELWALKDMWIQKWI